MPATLLAQSQQRCSSCEQHFYDEYKIEFMRPGRDDRRRVPSEHVSQLRASGQVLQRTHRIRQDRVPANDQLLSTLPDGIEPWLPSLDELLQIDGLASGAKTIESPISTTSDFGKVIPHPSATYRRRVSRSPFR